MHFGAKWMNIMPFGQVLQYPMAVVISFQPLNQCRLVLLHVQVGRCLQVFDVFFSFHNAVFAFEEVIEIIGLANVTACLILCHGYSLLPIERPQRSPLMYDKRHHLHVDR